MSVYERASLLLWESPVFSPCLRGAKRPSSIKADKGAPTGLHLSSLLLRSYSFDLLYSI